MATNWPSGAALPPPRKRHKRPRSKATREAGRVALLQSQLPDIHARARRWELRNNDHLIK